MIHYFSTSKQTETRGVHTRTSTLNSVGLQIFLLYMPWSELFIYLFVFKVFVYNNWTFYFSGWYDANHWCAVKFAIMWLMERIQIFKIYLWLVVSKLLLKSLVGNTKSVQLIGMKKPVGIKILLTSDNWLIRALGTMF